MIISKEEVEKITGFRGRVGTTVAIPRKIVFRTNEPFRVTIPRPAQFYVVYDTTESYCVLLPVEV